MGKRETSILAVAALFLGSHLGGAQRAPRPRRKLLRRHCTRIPPSADGRSGDADDGLLGADAPPGRTYEGAPPYRQRCLPRRSRGRSDGYRWQALRLEKRRHHRFAALGAARALKHLRERRRYSLIAQDTNVAPD